MVAAEGSVWSGGVKLCCGAQTERHATGAAYTLPNPDVTSSAGAIGAKSVASK